MSVHIETQMLGRECRVTPTNRSTASFSQKDEAKTAGSEKQEGGGFRRGHRHERAASAVEAAASRSSGAPAANRNGVGIHRHRAIFRQSSAATNRSAGVQSDARKRENISFEGTSCAKSR